VSDSTRTASVADNHAPFFVAIAEALSDYKEYSTIGRNNDSSNQQQQQQQQQQ